MPASLPEWAAQLNRLAPVLLDAALRGLVILSLVGVAATAFRRASAATRHWLWLLGFAGLLLIPILSASLPAWRVLPHVNAPAPTVQVAAAPMLPVAPVPVASGIEAAPTPVATPAVAQASTAAPVAAVQTSRPPVAFPAPAVRTASHAAPFPWTVYLVLAWLAGAFLALGHLALAHISLYFLQRRCSRMTHGDWPQLLNQLRALLSIRRPVNLLITPQRTMPMTWGLWRSRLLLPAISEDWPAEQRRAVLLHELAHVRRHDCLTQLLAQFACALYWFNPLVWLAWHRMQLERERACDDLVLATGAKASAYARHLLQSAAAMPVLRFVGAAALAMARPSKLESRLRAILDARRNRGTLSTAAAGATFLLLLAVLVPVAALRAQDATVPVPVPASQFLPATRPAASMPETRPAASPSTARGRSGTPTPARGLRIPGAAPGEGPTCIMDATVYDIRVPADQIGRLDLDALAKAAATPAQFEKALAELGPAQPLYRVNQSVRLGGDYLMFGSQTPYVSNSQNTTTGVVNTVQYASVGVDFNLTGKIVFNGSIDLDMDIGLSSLSPSATTVSTGVKAPMFRVIRMSHKGFIEPHKPFVVATIDASSVDADGKAIAYIARITMGDPKTPAATSRGP